MSKRSRSNSTEDKEPDHVSVEGDEEVVNMSAEELSEMNTDIDNIMQKYILTRNFHLSDLMTVHGFERRMYNYYSISGANDEGLQKIRDNIETNYKETRLELYKKINDPTIHPSIKIALFINLRSGGIFQQLIFQPNSFVFHYRGLRRTVTEYLRDIFPMTSIATTRPLPHGLDIITPNGVRMMHDTIMQYIRKPQYQCLCGALVRSSTDPKHRDPNSMNEILNRFLREPDW